MRAYVGAKIIKAEPMTDLVFEEERALYQSAKGAKEAYERGQSLVRSAGENLCAGPNIRDPKPGYKVMYPDGYVSWSPKATFEACYREISHKEGEIVLNP